jgi:hypothetical protein
MPFHELTIFSKSSSINLSFHQTVILPEFFFIILPFDQLCLSFHQLAISPTCHFIHLSFHQLVISSTHHFINLSFHQLLISSTWNFINLPFHQPAISSTHLYNHLLLCTLCLHTSKHSMLVNGSSTTTPNVTFGDMPPPALRLALLTQSCIKCFLS